jgi:hypothetical protein
MDAPGHAGMVAGQELARVMAILGLEDVEGLIDFYLCRH